MTKGYLDLRRLVRNKEKEKEKEVLPNIYFRIEGGIRETCASKEYYASI
jgi:hypothetical protein